MIFIENSQDAPHQIAFRAFIGLLSQADHTNTSLGQRSDVEFADDLIPEKTAVGVYDNKFTLKSAIKDGIDHGLKAWPLVGCATLGVFELTDDVVSAMLAICLELFALIWNGKIFLGLLACRNSQINNGAAAW
nr:hypothetical protein [Pseudophaeobacter sp. EL27]